MSNLINSLILLVQKMFSEDIQASDAIELTRSAFSFHDDTQGFYFLPYALNSKLLINLKYSDEKATAQIVKPLYNALVGLRKELVDEKDFELLIIPLPQSRLRVLRRGFNQSRRLLFETLRLDKKRLFCLEVNNLVKIRETRKQALLTRRERLVEQRGAFFVRRPERIKGKTIILFDDIITTGASLSEAKKTLLKARAKHVIPVALAH
jgi:ComF family protein